MPQRKGEGRVEPPRPRLGELLLRHGVVTIEQVHAALKHQRSTGKRLGKNLVQLGYLDENTLVKFLATQLHIACANLNKMEIPPEVQRFVPLEVMREAGVLPVRLHENTLYLGMTDPTDIETLHRIDVPPGTKIAAVVLPQSQWEFAMDFFKKHGWGRQTLAKSGKREGPRQDYDLGRLLEEFAAQGGSALHLCAGMPPAFRVDGRLVHLEAPPLTAPRIEELILPQLTPPQRARFEQRAEVDCALAAPGMDGFQVNLYRTHGRVTAVLRRIPETVPSLKELGLPPWLFSFVSRKQGLILIAGPSGHGKTTTLASLVDVINSTRRANIIILEDPVEYTHAHKLSHVNQREVGSDTPAFAEGLRQILRQDPDVIVIGALRDPESCAAALAAVESGRLVLAALPEPDVPGAIDRLIDAFPERQRDQARRRLAAALLLVFAQRLVPRAEGPGLALAYERLAASPRVRNAVREQGGRDLRRRLADAGEDFTPLEGALAELCRRGEIRYEEGLKFVEDERLYETLVKTE